MPGWLGVACTSARLGTRTLYVAHTLVLPVRTFVARSSPARANSAAWPSATRCLRSISSSKIAIFASSTAACTVSRRLLMPTTTWRSEEHTSELQSLMRISYAVFCLKKKKKKRQYLYTNNSYAKRTRDDESKNILKQNTTKNAAMIQNK